MPPDPNLKDTTEKVTLRIVEYEKSRMITHTALNLRIIELFLQVVVSVLA